MDEDNRTVEESHMTSHPVLLRPQQPGLQLSGRELSNRSPPSQRLLDQDTLKEVKPLLRFAAEQRC